MTEFRTILNNINRKTYLKGKFRGKYYGFLDEYSSDLVHENYYSIEILEAETIIEEKDIRKWTEGEEFEEFVYVEPFPSKLPKDTCFIINYLNGESRKFTLDLKDPKLANIRLFDILYEENKVFGSIEGDICGYILHVDQVKLVIPPDIESKNRAEETLENARSKGPIKSPAEQISFENILRETPDFESNDKTNETPENLRSRSSEQRPSAAFSIWNTLGEILAYAILVFYGMALLIWGWPIILFIGIILVLQLLGNIIQPVIRYAGRAFISFSWLFFLIFICFVLFSYWSNDPNMIVTPQKPDNTEMETTDYQPIEDGILNDSIIRHFRVWKDYAGAEYSGYLSIKTSEWKSSESYHQNTPIAVASLNDFDMLLRQFIANDSSKLTGVYSLFDSVQVSHKLNEKLFAEAIVSCIQDIPYTLVLDQACDPLLYNDQFIFEYLSSGGNCHPNVKFGIFSPVEFIATLDGDCDTRALLLFTILSHYGYDVVMLSSEIYRHSIIAINLPYMGVSKTINRKRYVLWETTQAGIAPGVFPSKMSNMNNWYVNLISTKNL
ncbi:MAG: hypothetical protein H6576_04005 [Lewinellaceae bacterium]|nr:hypothetical protein [Saprospiraceae bacterium]MCB9342831.1 hypothetical protein [Lewinellaceae bacterium]